MTVKVVPLLLLPTLLEHFNIAFLIYILIVELICVLEPIFYVLNEFLC